MEKLFEPGNIGTLKLQNRIIMPAMTTNLGTRDGFVSQKLTDYYVERAKGGVGLIVVESALSLDSDKSMPGLRELTNAIKNYNTKVGIQLSHRQKLIGVRRDQILPSLSRSIGRMSPKDIENLMEMFAGWAKRAKDAGFDAIEISAAHGTTGSLFLSKATNKRTDIYGGGWDGRARFLTEMITRVRRKVGKEYPLIIRMNVEDFEAGGNTVEDSKAIAKRLEAAGANALSLSAGIEYTSPNYCIPPYIYDRGRLAPYSEKIKEIVSIPVIVAHRINDPDIAETILKEGKADFTAMGRALIADPELPKKASLGKLDEIRKCIGCCQGCQEQISKQAVIRCLVNPCLGMEKEQLTEPVREPRKVLVVGGGPAGMEGARTASLGGHQVYLCEKSDRLGGQFRLASKPCHKEEFESLITYLENQLRKQGVRVDLEKEVTPSMIEEMEPDVVIMATGADPILPKVQGVERENVFTPEDVLSEKAEVGEKVVVVGGGLIGIDTACFLAGKGKNVTITSRRQEIGTDLIGILKWLLPNALRERFKVQMIPGATLKEVTSKGISYIKDGKEESLEVDTVVLAAGVRSNRKLLEALEGKGIEFYAIGDCVEPRDAMVAIYEGWEIARKI